MNKFLEQLKSGWFIILAIVGLIIWYANVSMRLTSLEAKAQEQETALVQLMQIKTDVAVIKAQVDYLYKNLR